MLGNIALYLANRASAGAVGSIARWARWGAVAGLFLLCAAIFGICAVFWALAPTFGAVPTAAAIAAGSALAGLVCLATPAALDQLERRAKAKAAAATDPVSSGIAAAKEETEAAVDYFGPLQVVTSAFLVGLSTGRGVLGKSRPRPVA